MTKWAQGWVDDFSALHMSVEKDAQQYADQVATLTSDGRSERECLHSSLTSIVEG